MRIGVLGINHKSSALSFREQLAKACRKHLSSDHEISWRLGCVVLSTCNRTEIYFHAEDLASAHSELLHLLRIEIAEPFEHMLYTYFGTDCFAHLALVTGGLDSVILAESEIQRQVKVAYEQTCSHYPLPSSLHFLFQKCLKIGKQIRSSCSLPRSQTGLPTMIWEISQWILKDVAHKKILFVGNSDINRKIFFHLYSKGARNLTLCTRSLEAAEEYRGSLGMQLIPFSNVRSWIEYDLIICGTNFSDYFILSSHLSQQERVSSKLLLDLSVPRTIDPRLAQHPHLTLLNMEDLGRLIEKKQQRDLEHIREAERLVLTQVERQVELFHYKTQQRILSPSRCQTSSIFAVGE